LKLGLRSVANGLLPAQELLKQKALEQLTYIDGLIGEVRRLYHGLSPGNLEDLGLTRALQGLIEDFAGLYDYITWEMELPDLGGLFPESVQTIIYRIFQEALTNIGKHADAGQVRVSAVIKAAQVHFAIQDDGKGFAPSEVQGSTPGVGLAAMEERLNMVGGSFRIWSRKEGGTRISFSIPTLPEA
jgi:signal transduction histidine kinase